MALSVALGRRANLKYFSVIPRIQLNWRIGSSAKGFRSICSSAKEEFEMGNSYCVSFEKVESLPGQFGGTVLTIQHTEKDQSVSKVFSSVSASPTLPDTSPRLKVDYQGKRFRCNDRVGTGVSFPEKESAPIIRTPIRRLFPAHFYHDVKVMAKVLCCHGEQDTDIMVANATSAALMLSDIPWGGPIGVVRIARIQGHFVINPSLDELFFCDLDLVYACTRDQKTLMADVQAREVTKKDREEALQIAHRQAVKYLAPQIELAKKAGKPKKDYTVSMLKDSTVKNITSLVEASSQASFPDFENEKVETVVGNEVEVGRLHEDEATETQSCVEVNGGYVLTSEKPIKQVDPLSGKVYAVQRQEYFSSSFSGVDQSPHRCSKFSSQMKFLNLSKYHDVEPELLEWLQTYDYSDVTESEMSESETSESSAKIQSG